MEGHTPHEEAVRGEVPSCMDGGCYRRVAGRGWVEASAWRGTRRMKKRSGEVVRWR